MHPTRLRRSLGTGGLAAGLLAVLVGTGISARHSADAGSDRPTGQRLAEAPLASDQRAGPVQHPVEDVTLPTGDRIRLARLPGGQQTASPLPPDRDHPGSGSVQFIRFTVGGDLYVVPGAAVGALGGTLDMGLFDVSYLARAGFADGGAASLPLVASLDPGVAAPAVPGLALGGGPGAERSAQLDKAQSWRLGRALAAAGRTARPGQGKRAGTAALPGVRRLALAPPRAGVAAPPTAHGTALSHAGNGIPRRTLTVNAVDRTGAPSLAILFLQNVDDSQRYLSVSLVEGTSSFSVPEGTYMLAANVLRLHEDGVGYDSAFVAEPERAVTAPSVSVTLDARTAQPISASVDGVPTATGLISLSFDRADARGNDMFFGAQVALAYGLAGTADDGLFATPTRPVRTGSFGFSAYVIASPGTSFDLQGNHYILDFPSDRGVPASLAYRVSPARLTRHDQTYHWPDLGPVAAPCSLMQGFNVAETWSAYGGGYFVPLPGASQRTDYLYSPASTTWYELAQTPACQYFLNSWRHLRPGRTAEDWFAAPMVPAVQREQMPLEVAPGVANAPSLTNVQYTYGCPACRQDDNLSLRIAPWGDSTADHAVTVEVDQGIASTARLYQNGALAMTSVAPYALYPALPTAASYRLDWELTKTAPYWPLSTRVATSWTFRSDPAARAQRPPPYEQCTPDRTVSCAMLPLLFATWDLPLALDNSAPAGGSFPVSVRVSRQEHMSAPRGLSVRLEVSYDDGASWHPAGPARRTGDGRFTATLAHPAAAGYVSLRLHARDADGNTVDQTVIRAYRLVNR